MKAIVKYEEGYGNMELRDVPEPDPGDNEVKIKAKAVGICGSDLHIYKGDIGIPTKVPFIVGHEFSGIVTEIGAHVNLPGYHATCLQAPILPGRAWSS